MTSGVPQAKSEVVLFYLIFLRSIQKKKKCSKVNKVMGGTLCLELGSLRPGAGVFVYLDREMEGEERWEIVGDSKR